MRAVTPLAETGRAAGKAFTTRRRFWLSVELFVLAGLVPLAVWYIRTHDVARIRPFPILWAAMAYCLWHLLRDPTFDRHDLWRAGAVPKGIKHVLLRFLILGTALTAGVYLFLPDRFASLMRQAPHIMLIITVAYPVLSVYPQGVICRVFLLHRYRQLIPRDAVRIGVAVVTFSYMHLLFENGIAIVLTLVGGTFFTLTQYRHRSLLLSSIEHSLFGILIFASGLGEFFFSGANRAG
ncbi:MAG: CPBP family glutamic-type intramembrane protease [Planctomycetota bacterium]